MSVLSARLRYRNHVEHYQLAFDVDYALARASGGKIVIEQYRVVRVISIRIHSEKRSCELKVGWLLAPAVAEALLRTLTERVRTDEAFSAWIVERLVEKTRESLS